MTAQPYDRELIARMLTRDGRFGAGAIVEQARLLREAHNRDAAGVHTASRGPLEESIARLRYDLKPNPHVGEGNALVLADDLERVLRVVEAAVARHAKHGAADTFWIPGMGP